MPTTTKLYKFKGNKHSIIMRLISVAGDGSCVLQDIHYPIQHEANIKDIEEVKENE